MVIHLLSRTLRIRKGGGGGGGGGGDSYLRFFPLLTQSMANSKFEYVREFEEASEPLLLRNCFLVVRVDGRNFHKFSKVHNFYKPNDKRCLDLMAEAAKFVIKEFYPDIVMAYGQSDEFSFVFRKTADVFNRRQNKIISLVVSSFSSAFVFNWSKYFGGQSVLKNMERESRVQLLYPPSFDGRCVLYPALEELADYLRWRQVDCHINNLYNTTFHALTGEYTKYSKPSPNSGDDSLLTVTEAQCSTRLSPQEAEERLRGSISSEKQEILFSEFGVNYNNELEQFKKGTLIALPFVEKKVSRRKVEKQKEKSNVRQPLKLELQALNIDVINEKFWTDFSFLFQT